MLPFNRQAKPVGLKAIKPNQEIIFIFPVNQFVYFRVIFEGGFCVFHELFVDLTFSRKVQLQVSHG